MQKGGHKTFNEMGQMYILLLEIYVDKVPVEDLGNNRSPSSTLHVVKGDQVGTGGWSVIKYNLPSPVHLQS